MLLEPRERLRILQLASVITQAISNPSRRHVEINRTAEVNDRINLREFF